MRDKKLDMLFQKFDMHVNIIQQIMRQIEHAEKKREIDSELDALLEKYNITKACDDTGRGDSNREL